MKAAGSLSMVPAALRSLPKILPVPRTVRCFILLGAAVALTLNIRRILWPNIATDPAFIEPLPPGSLGCPLFGQQIFVGSKSFGTGYFWHRMSKFLKHPRVFMIYFMGRPGAVISGGERVKNLLNKEFDEDGIYTGVNPTGILGKGSLLAEKDRKRHSYLRRLVGSALTPAAVSAAVPNMQIAAEKQVTKMLQSNGSSVNSEKVCTDFTVDVAWKQILGLDLQEDEISVFQNAVDTWVAGFADLRVVLNVFPKSAPAFKARDYLTRKITERVDYLELNGPDASTLSGMVFATDKEDASQTLTREEIVENSLLLMLAGSETSATTLTNAIFCLGLNHDAWTKLVREQEEMRANHGEKLTRSALDKECPYLDAVVKETMRIKPLSSGAPRFLKKTIAIDGYQIPEGWGVNWNVLLTHELDPVTFKEDESHMDPKKGFVPERWLEEKTRPTSDFIPMGAGPRYCLGATLAYTEMKIFLAILARNIEFTLTGTTDEWKRMSILPKPADGVPVTVAASTM